MKGHGDSAFNRRGQGLPINFIVLAALAILILILIVAFVIATGTSFTGAIAPEQARTTCTGFCSQAQRTAADVYDTTGITTWQNDVHLTNEKFCTSTFVIKGIGKNTTCSQLVGSCVVTFGDGTTFALDTDTCP